MQLRLATHDDLPALREMYARIIIEMNEQGMYFWDDEYPYMRFAPDIEHNRMYVLVEEVSDAIIGAFALSDANEGDPYVVWEKPGCKAKYIDRLGIHVDYKRKGIGSLMIDQIMKITKECGGEYVRLFVVNTNPITIDFYVNNGFHQVEGMYEACLDGINILQEYGFEKRCD